MGARIPELDVERRTRHEKARSGVKFTPSRLDRLLERPVRPSVLVLVTTLLVLPAVFGLEIDNTLEVWLDETSPAYLGYEAFRSAFGSEEFILVIYPCPDEIDLPFLERLVDLRFELEEIEGVRRVDDLASVYSRFYSMRGIEAFRQELHGSPLARGVLVSPDGEWAASSIQLERVRGKERSAVVDAVEGAVDRAPPAEAGSVRLAGSPYLNAELDRSSQAAARTFFPLVFLLSAAVLWVLFRRLSAVLIPFVSVGTGIVWTLAILRWSGSSLNMVTLTLPPLVWVLGLSTAIHLLSRWQRAVVEGNAPGEATRVSVRELFGPCLSSSLTTATGFASLLASSMGPVREMGAYSAVGILLCFASNFVLFPALVGLSARISKRLPRMREDHPFFEFLNLASRRPGKVFAATGILALILALGIPRLMAESNPIEFFRDDAPASVTYKRVLADFTGAYSLEVTLEPPELDLDALVRVDELRAFLESEEGVARALSVVDFLKQAHREASGEDRLPATESELEDAWRRVEEHPEELEAFLSHGVLRISVLAKPMDSSGHERLVDHIESHLERQIDPDWRPRLTGIVSLLVDMQQRLIRSQGRTFALAFLAIMLVLGLLLGRMSYAVISLAPNLLPIVFALGTMGWLEIPLDPATVMIASIALGIAVDDTIHFLAHYRKRREAGVTREDAVEETLEVVGRPMVITSLVSALGFLVLCWSDFVPLFHFGLLTAVTMGTALLGDLVVLPALLQIRSRPRPLKAS